MKYRLDINHTVGGLYPVLGPAGSLFKAFLQPLSNPSGLLELFHQRLRVLEVSDICDGLQGSDVTLTGLLQRGHGQSGQPLLVGPVPPRDSSPAHRLDKVVRSDKSTSFGHPHLQQADRDVTTGLTVTQSVNLFSCWPSSSEDAQHPEGSYNQMEAFQSRYLGTISYTMQTTKSFNWNEF